MTSPVLADTCDAEPWCMHAPCFQVQLDASSPAQAHRQSNACAYHVADVIELQRAWAAQHGLADGQLTILAVEPAVGGRQPGEPGDLRGFAFTTIPLSPAPVSSNT
jgi:hypothetical protein